VLRHEKSGIDVDLSCAGTAFELEALRRATRLRLGRRRIALPTPEDLIVFKAIAHRPRDLFDIEGIVLAHPDLEVARIRRWLDHFAADSTNRGSSRTSNACSLPQSRSVAEGVSDDDAVSGAHKKGLTDRDRKLRESNVLFLARLSMGPRSDNRG
jgi:hypothetical protein